MLRAEKIIVTPSDMEEGRKYKFSLNDEKYYILSKPPMKSIGNPKTFRRFHNDTSASDRLETLNISSSRQAVDR